MSTRLTLLISALCISLTALAVCITKVTVQPEIRYIVTEIPVEVEKPYPVETIVKITEIQEVPRIIEVEKVVFKPLKNFATPTELYQWLKKDTVSNIFGSNLYDCDDYCTQLVENAFKDGYRMDFQVLPAGTKSSYLGVLTEPHMVCSAIIGNSIYFIEPQTDYIWVEYEID